MPVAVGDSAELTFRVTANDTAAALKSGSVAVLATPRLIAWVEAATVKAISASLSPGTTTVGTRVDVSHVAASPVGAVVQVSAQVVDASSKRVYFDVQARHRSTDNERRVVMSGRIARAIVEERRFIGSLRTQAN